MTRIGILSFVLGAALALPVLAQDCLSGPPKRMIFNTGGAIRIIQRHGEDFTYEAPYPGGNNVVSKTHLGIFPRDSRLPNRYFEYRWSDRLPKAGDLTPGFHFDVRGTMAATKDDPRSYRIAGDVLGEGEVMVGTCPYRTLRISKTTYVGDVPVGSATLDYSPDLNVVLRTEDTGGKTTIVVGLE